MHIDIKAPKARTYLVGEWIRRHTRNKKLTSGAQKGITIPLQQPTPNATLVTLEHISPTILTCTDQLAHAVYANDTPVALEEQENCAKF